MKRKKSGGVTFIDYSLPPPTSKPTSKTTSKLPPTPVIIPKPTAPVPTSKPIAPVSTSISVGLRAGTPTTSARKKRKRPGSEKAAKIEKEVSEFWTTHYALSPDNHIPVSDVVNFFNSSSNTHGASALQFKSTSGNLGFKTKKKEKKVAYAVVPISKLCRSYHKTTTLAGLEKPAVLGACRPLLCLVRDF